MPRLFVGIPLPDSYHEKSRTLARELDRRIRSTVRWIAYGNAHITLLFLGDTDSDHLSGIRECLGRIRYPAFPLRAGPCGCFPGAARPRVLYAGIATGAKHCAALAEAVAHALASLKVKGPSKPYTPHITLGRIKRNASDDWSQVLSGLPDDWPEYQVDRFTLWESTLTPEGAVYRPLQEFPLGKKTE